MIGETADQRFDSLIAGWRSKQVEVAIRDGQSVTKMAGSQRTVRHRDRRRRHAHRAVLVVRAWRLPVCNALDRSTRGRDPRGNERHKRRDDHIEDQRAEPDIEYMTRAP